MRRVYPQPPKLGPKEAPPRAPVGEEPRKTSRFRDFFERAARAKPEALQLVQKVGFAVGCVGMAGEYGPPTLSSVLTRYVVVPAFLLGGVAVAEGTRGNFRRARDRFKAPSGEEG